ncbi:Nuclear actin-protein involved in chromatin remodeling [Dimargaris xerosporica]|nr:Nuclear actin-protein involved in chromatin remodeling [Dimargaris xerosporica]
MLFQPSIIGIDQAGLLEVMDHALRQLSAQHGVQIRKFFVTGGSSLIPNLANRLQVGIQSLLPAGSPFEVVQARDPVLDAWCGAAQWAHELQATKTWNQYAVTRADYDECGPHYLKEHPMGNRFYQPQ